MSETPKKQTVGHVPYKDSPGEVCFSQDLYSSAALLFFPQTFLIWAFIKHGFGYEYLLLSVAIVNLGLYAHARQYLISGKTKTLKPFTVVTGYAVITALLYGFPMALVGTFLMTGAYSGIPVSETFLENNRSLVMWVAGLDFPGNRPQLDMNNPKNILNVYYMTLVFVAATLSTIMSLLLLPAKLRGWRHLFEVSGNTQPVLGRVLLFSAMAGTCAYFLYCFTSKYTFGYELLRNGQLSPNFETRTWVYQVLMWSLIGSTFTFFLSGAIASAIRLFALEDDTQMRD